MAAVVVERSSERTWNVNVGTSVPYTVFDKVESIVEKEAKARAVVLRKLLLRGIAAYERDGSLDDLEIMRD